jgi:hypothetical protein
MRPAIFELINWQYTLLAISTASMLTTLVSINDNLSELLVNSPIKDLTKELAIFRAELAWQEMVRSPGPVDYLLKYGSPEKALGGIFKALSKYLVNSTDDVEIIKLELQDLNCAVHKCQEFEDDDSTGILGHFTDRFLEIIPEVEVINNILTRKYDAQTNCLLERRYPIISTIEPDYNDICFEYPGTPDISYVARSPTIATPRDNFSPIFFHCSSEDDQETVRRCTGLDTDKNYQLTNYIQSIDPNIYSDCGAYQGKEYVQTCPNGEACQLDVPCTSNPNEFCPVEELNMSPVNYAGLGSGQFIMRGFDPYSLSKIRQNDPAEENEYFTDLIYVGFPDWLPDLNEPWNYGIFNIPISFKNRCSRQNKVFNLDPATGFNRFFRGARAKMMYVAGKLSGEDGHRTYMCRFPGVTEDVMTCEFKFNLNTDSEKDAYMTGYYLFTPMLIKRVDNDLVYDHLGCPTMPDCEPTFDFGLAPFDPVLFPFFYFHGLYTPNGNISIYTQIQDQPRKVANGFVGAYDKVRCSFSNNNVLYLPHVNENDYHNISFADYQITVTTKQEGYLCE